jgi:hypothetical protein
MAIATPHTSAFKSPSTRSGRYVKISDSCSTCTAKANILVRILPHLLRVLIARGYITREMLGDGKRLDAVFRKHARLASERFEVVIALEEDFAKDAFRLWHRGRKYAAIVLFATAVEQALNGYYRHAFLASGLTNDDITTIIRTQNLETKLTWLNRLATNSSFPKALRRRLLALSQIRNHIVHYKAVPGHPDRAADSHETIKRKLRQLGRVSLRRDFQLLQHFLTRTILQHDPAFELAYQAAQQIVDYRGYSIRYELKGLRLTQPVVAAADHKQPKPHAGSAPHSGNDHR